MEAVVKEVLPGANAAGGLGRCCVLLLSIQRNAKQRSPNGLVVDV